ADNGFEKFNITLLVGYDPLPIPLIDVSRVVVIEKIILADSPHVSADTFSGTAIELLQGDSFPFRGGLDDLSFDRILTAIIRDVKLDRSARAIAVQHVINAGFGVHDQGDLNHHQF